MYFGIDLSAHERHEAFADEQPQTVALYLIGIAAAMKTPEYLWKFLFFKGTARVRHCDQLTAVHFIKIYFYPPAVTVFDCIFDQILQTFSQAVSIAVH